MPKRVQSLDDPQPKGSNVEAPPSLLQGSVGWSAVEALRDFDAPVLQGTRDEPATVRFAATVRPSATVGQVNDALIAVGARIVVMRAGDPTFSFEVARSDRIDVRSLVVRRLETSEAFESVAPQN